MTACIVGWAHTPFGRLDGETVESLIVRVATEALADAGVAPADVDEIVLGHFNAGFSAQDFTASLVLQASPDLRFKRATRVENACATGSAAVHQGLQAIAAKSARIVLVVGVEQMTTTPGPEIGRNLLKASYVREEADIDGGFAGIFGRIAGLYFQKYGDQSDALADDRGEEPQERRRQSLCADAQGSRLRVLPARKREEPVRRRSAQAHRLLAGLRRRRGLGAGRRGHRAQHGQGGGVPRRRACAGFPADGEARHPEVRGLRASVAARARRGGRGAWPIFVGRDARLLHHRRTDRVRGHGARAAQAAAPAPSRMA